MNIKKVALTLASVAAITTFAPEASAIPAFARQVGMACSACHYQHFPVLNAFGRSFKQGGYTMVGTQEKIEGDGISLPATENLAIIGYMSYAKTDGQNASPSALGSKNTNDGMLQIPQQISLFAGGRGGENFGYEAETNIGGPGVGGTAGIIRLKVPFVKDMGSVTVEVIPFATANGVADSFETLNTGAVNVHTFNQWNQSTLSAAQYIGTGTAAHGGALVVGNGDFFVNLAKWGASPGDGTSGGPSSSYVRAAWTTDMISGFDTAIGVQSWSGNSTDATGSAITASTGLPAVTYLNFTSTCSTTGATTANPALCSIAANTTNAVPTTVQTKATAIDAQMMGDVGGMPLLVTASYAIAPATAAADLANPTDGQVNLFNVGTLDKSSINIAAELGIVPNVATVQLAYRNAKSGQDLGLATGGSASGQNATDNAVMVGATYAIALNARLELSYTMFSGDMYSTAVKNAAIAGNNNWMGSNFTSFSLNFGL